MSKLRWVTVVLALILLLTACRGEAPPEIGAAYQVWIDAPLDGAHVPSGASIPVMAHGSMPGGVTRMELLVNGEPIADLQVVTLAEGLQEGRGTWTPPGEGTYWLRVRATDAAGNTVTSAPVRVVVGEAIIEEDTTPTPTPEPEEVTLTPTPTISPPPSPTPFTPTPTSTPVTPTPTSTPTASPTPAAYIAFWADATTVPAGSCTTIRWETENVQAVYLDGQGVPGDGSRQVCPCTPETHTLEVVLRDGSHEVRTLTIDVTGSCVTPTPTPDTVPPPVPQPIGPGTTDENRPESTSCPLTLRWNPVSDPSGVVYNVTVIRQSYGGNWELVGSWYGLTATELEIGGDPNLCGYALYAWNVQAEDGARNRSSPSQYLYYEIPIP